jgi:hypothetical protein
VKVFVGNAYSIILAKLGAVYQAVSATPPKQKAQSDLKRILATIRANDQFMALDDLLPRLSAVEKTLQTGNPKDLQTPVQELALRFLREGDIIVGLIAPQVKSYFLFRARASS